MELIDTYEAAALLRTSPSGVRNLARKGLLTNRGYKPREARYGRPRALFDRAEVEAQATRRLRLSAA